MVYNSNSTSATVCLAAAQLGWPASESASQEHAQAGLITMVRASCSVQQQASSIAAAHLSWLVCTCEYLQLSLGLPSCKHHHVQCTVGCFNARYAPIAMAAVFSTSSMEHSHMATGA
jgi:hypothetical protein